MIIALLIGAILGLILAVPPGPVGMAQIRFGLQGDFKPGRFFAYGVGMMDAFYCLIAIFATSVFEAAIRSFTNDHPYIMFAIQVLIVLFFVVFGIISVRSKTNNIEGPITEKKATKFIDQLKHKGPFLLGVAIALTNLANPTFLPTIAYVTMTVHQLEFIENNIPANVSFAIGYGVGNVIWLVLLLRLVLHYKSKMSPMTITRIRQFAGVTLIGFGTFLGYRLISLAKWHEIVRLVFSF